MHQQISSRRLILIMRVIATAGSKAAVAKAFSDGVIDAVGAKSAVVKQHASNLRHWLHTDALYGVQYVKVSAAVWLPCICTALLMLMD